MKIPKNPVKMPNLSPPKPKNPTTGSKPAPSQGAQLAKAAEKLQDNDNSDATRLLKQGKATLDASGLQAPELDQVTKVAEDIQKVAATTAKLKGQIEGIYDTVTNYLTEVRDTATGPYTAMKAHIEETRDRMNDPDSPIPALATHVQEKIDRATGPIAEPVDPGRPGMFPDVVTTPTPGSPIPIPIPYPAVDPGLVQGVREEAEWMAGWTKDTAGRLGDQAGWMADWTKDTVAATKHLYDLAISAPSVARDVVDQTKAAVETAQTLAEQARQLQKDLDKLSNQTGADAYIPMSATARRV